MHGPRPIPRGEHTTKTFDDDLIVPHCLNKTVTQRKWLPQIKCYPNRGGNRVGGGISKMAKQELLATIRNRYQASSRKEKSRILDEFIAVTGHHRKHGIRLLGQSGDDWEQWSPNAAGTPTAMGVALNPCGDWRPYLSVSRLMYSLHAGLCTFGWCRRGRRSVERKLRLGVFSCRVSTPTV